MRFVPGRPTSAGIEMHLAVMHKQVRAFSRSWIVDPISNLADAGSRDAAGMLLRLLDFFKAQGITAVFTCLTKGGDALEGTAVGISSVIDTWVLVRDIEVGGERNRGLNVLKSRGMWHSNQVREFPITGQGIQLKEVYVGPEGVLTGSMRVAQEVRERSLKEARKRELESNRRSVERKLKALQAQMTSLGRRAGGRRGIPATNALHRAELEERDMEVRRGDGS